MYLTDKKVAIMGAAGAIGSNLVQDLLSTGTANNISMYDPFAQGLEGAAEEIYHCGYAGARVTYTTDVAEALSGAAYIISSGGAPRKEGMTREDLLRGNCEIAKGLGENIKQYCPAAEFVVVIFNPADITGLTTLVYSGLPAGHVSTLAALDSTRLQTRLSQHFGVAQDDVTGCRTYGGHGEQMAVFKGGIAVQGVSLPAILAGAKVNGKALSAAEWAGIQEHTRTGGARIIKLRGRSSYQSPSHQSVEMLRGRINVGGYPWPCGAYFRDGEFAKVMMAADVKFTPSGISPVAPQGLDDDMAALRESYKHVAALRDEVIAAGVLPPVSEWGKHNPNL
ncbi:MAG TPA: malate dehydrogenase [Armatimonadota bacterium]|jgi:malate dehydrogenase